ncbi:MAG TPA: Holliday junction resolvase RuvX [Thermoleophilia bacterium]|nr:Holliday junction resolvase RuvX [Thermoleophilia bacterium]
MMRVMALDHGAARTGVAVSDPTGTVATPLATVDRVDGDAGFARLLELIAEQRPEEIVVGLPVSLDGREHAQAARARAFARRLAAAVSAPVTTYDERFTTKLAAQRGGRAPEDARGGRAPEDARGGRAPEDARAAAVLLEDYLRARAARSGPPASAPGGEPSAPGGEGQTDA